MLDAAMRRLCFLLAALAVAAADTKTSRPPNLSGAWELVLEKSDFGRMPPPKSVVNIIEHKEPFIQVNSTMELPQGKYTATLKYRSTGAQDENDSYGTAMTTFSKWFGSEFVIEGEVVAKTKWIRFRERWSLADGGQTLINNRVMFMASGEVPQKLVFRRVKAAKK
jgi:hypothetical protein